MKTESQELLQEEFLKKFSIKKNILGLITGKDIFTTFGCQLKVIFNEKDGYILLFDNQKKGHDFIGLSLIFGFLPKKVILDGIYLPKKHQGKGLGKQYLQGLVSGLQQIGIHSIQGKMSRRSKENEVGYYVRPRLGFNGLKGSKKLYELCLRGSQRYKALSLKFLGCKDILDLMDFEEGRIMWKELGFPFVGYFALSNQKSLDILYKN